MPPLPFVSAPVSPELDAISMPQVVSSPLADVNGSIVQLHRAFFYQIQTVVFVFVVFVFAKLLEGSFGAVIGVVGDWSVDFLAFSDGLLV